ncbi:MAG: hypothetical protein KGZ74_18715 [Chitinophagaceae bacterium]|nr:hypothetical protein [Chitinophagaceae bacterium]
MDLFVVILFTLVLFGFIARYISQTNEIIRQEYLWLLAIVHIGLSVTYSVYALSSASDSRKYFKVSSQTENWMDLFDTGTSFISFLAWPFTRMLGMSYYPAMICFSFLGLIGIVLLYLAAKEHVSRQKNDGKLIGFMELLFLLPNMHFWTSSIGKGSMIIFGIGIFFWGLSRFNKRPHFIILGALLVYFVRPHIMLAILLAIIVGLLFTNTGIKNFIKWSLFLLSLIIFFFISDNVLEFAEVTDINIFDSNELQDRALSLARANSGIDLSSYSLPMKLFAFWCRPLFVDTNNLVGFIVSFENLFYLYLFYLLITYSFFYWSKLNGWHRICLFVFLFCSLALSQISGNLGIALRQKAQIMPLLFIVIAKLYEVRNTLVNKETKTFNFSRN